MYRKTFCAAKNMIFSVFKGVRLNEIIMLASGLLLGGATLFDEICIFGVAVSNSYLKKGFRSFCVLLPMLGYILSGDFFKIKYVISCIALCILRETLSKADKLSKYDFASCFVYPVCALCAFFAEYGSIYDLFIIVIECVALFYFTRFYDVFLGYFSSKGLRRTVKQNELCAIVLVCTICLTRASGIELPFGINPAGVISIFIIMFCAFSFPLGITAVSGIILGTAVSVANPECIYCIGSYSVSALFGGLSKKYGKWGIVSSFIIANAVVTFYVNGSQKVLINLFDVIVAAIIFALCPKSGLLTAKENLMLLMASEKTREAKRLGIIKDFTYKKMSKLSSAFKGLAESLKSESCKKLILPDEEKMLIQNVAERVCKRCKNCGFCWGENQKQTFDIIKNLFGAVQRRGWAENYDLPSGFKNMCYISNTLVLEVNKVYELYRVNMVWERKLAENKLIMGRQLSEVGRLVSHLASELTENFEFETSTENNIIMILDELGIKVKEVIVLPEKERIKVYVAVKDCTNPKAVQKTTLAVVQKVTGKKMRVQEDVVKDGVCMISFSEKENFQVSTGVSRVRPENERVSGDSYAIITPGDGKTIIALSDGMGTGEKAATESTDAINLLEKLLNAGIEKEAAVRLINSVLILKAYDESFATLDMLVFDMYSGEGEFIKTGGVASYIKRGENVATINAGSLPAGIISTCDAKSQRVSLKQGDIIVIVSDGVTDAFRGEKAIPEILKSVETYDMKSLADYIMEQAIRKIIRPLDDMTVICALIE